MSLTSRTPSLGAVLLLIVAVVLLLGGDDDGDRSPGRGGESRERGGAGERSDHGGAPSGAPSSAPALVTRVVDGDTVEVRLAGREEDVRYIGVDTPESVAPGQPVECYGNDASEFNRSLVEGERVRLEYGAERRDVYGRLLAYVYLRGELVNAELLQRGYARTLAIAPNTDRAEAFDRIEQRAANAGRGLWGAC
jgi:micrococcal nuclease